MTAILEREQIPVVPEEVPGDELSRELHALEQKVGGLLSGWGIPHSSQSIGRQGAEIETIDDTLWEINTFPLDIMGATWTQVKKTKNRRETTVNVYTRSRASNETMQTRVFISDTREEDTHPNSRRTLTRAKTFITELSTAANPAEPQQVKRVVNTISGRNPVVYEPARGIDKRPNRRRTAPRT